MPAGHKDGDAYNIIYKLFTHAIVVLSGNPHLTAACGFSMIVKEMHLGGGKNEQKLSSDIFG